MAYKYKATFCGWFAFEGFGRPFESWVHNKVYGWESLGRTFTYRGARRKARKEILKMKKSK